MSFKDFFFLCDSARGFGTHSQQIAFHFSEGSNSFRANVGVMVV